MVSRTCFTKSKLALSCFTIASSAPLVCSGVGLKDYGTGKLLTTFHSSHYLPASQFSYLYLREGESKEEFCFKALQIHCCLISDLALILTDFKPYALFTMSYLWVSFDTQGSQLFSMLVIWLYLFILWGVSFKVFFLLTLFEIIPEGCNASQSQKEKYTTVVQLNRNGVS